MLLAMLMISCSSDSFDDVQEVNEPVVFSLSFGNTVTRAATVDNLWPANTQITISNGSNKTYTTGNNPSNVSGAATSLTPIGDDAFIWPTTNPSWSFSGWYPAGTSPTTNMTVAADQTIYDEVTNMSGITDAVYYGYDILYCPPVAVSFRQKPVALTFLHQMARVVVIVNSSYTETKETVTGVEFGGGRLAVSGNITNQPATNANGTTTWSVGTQNQTVKMRPNASKTDATSNVYAFECMLPPQSGGAKTTLNKEDNLILISSMTKEETPASRNYIYDTSFNMQAGYQYTYNLLISERGVITLATVKVTDWQTGTPINNSNGVTTIPGNNYPNSPINN